MQDLGTEGLNGDWHKFIAASQAPVFVRFLLLWPLLLGLVCFVNRNCMNIQRVGEIV